MDNINLELYKYFWYVAENKNVTKASTELLISQPALSQMIKKLELQIGYTLFYRTKKGMFLTKEGEILFKNIDASIQCLITAEKKLNDDLNGIYSNIKISSGTTNLKHNILPKINKFNKMYPNVNIEIIHGITSSEIINKLQNNLIDLAVVNNVDIFNDDLLYIPIEKVVNVFVSNSQEYANKTYNLKDIETFPLILQSQLSNRRQYLDNICRLNNINLHSKYNVSSYGLIIDFVNAGLGVGFLNKNHIKNELKNKTLFEIKIDHNFPESYVYVVVHKKNQTIKQMNDLINILTN